MSEIKLEVGQVWEVPTSGAFKVLEIFMQGTCQKIGYRKSYESFINYDQRDFNGFTYGKVLIKNADGTPHTPANDYQAGDVWEGTFNETIIQYFIYRHNLTLCYICGSGASGPVRMVNNFGTNPQDYKLIHREEE